MDLPNKDMKKPYTLHMNLPKIHSCEIEEKKVHGVPRIATEKSLLAKLNRIKFKGVHNCKFYH